MSWIILALTTIIFYSIFDLFLKLSSDKIHSGLGGFIINIFATITLLVYLIYSKYQGESVFQTKPGGYTYSILAGIAVGMATIFFIKVFAQGTNLSIGVPLIRVGMVLLGSLLGIFLLKEGVNFRYLAGAFFSLLGLFLLVSSR